MKKSTVSSTSPGAGQLFASVPRSFNSFGAVLLCLIAGLTDNVCGQLFYEPGPQSLAVDLVDAPTAGADWDSYTSTPTASTRTAYDWAADTSGANVGAVTLPAEPLSIQAFVDYLFREGMTAVVVDQVNGKVWASDQTAKASVTAVASFTTTSGNRWE